MKSTSPKRVGFIGTGAIAAPMVRYLGRKDHLIFVSERNRQVSTELAERFESVKIAANQEVVDKSDIVFLCLRPAVWSDVVPQLRFQAGQSIVSVMAGVSLAELKETCAPATDISVTIPLEYVENGGCPLPAFPTTDTLETLFGQDNPVIQVTSENALNAHFTATTIVSAVLTVMEEGASWLEQQTQDRKAAEIYVAALVAGFLRDVPKDGNNRILEARGSLATEGTLAIQMVEAMEKEGVGSLLKESLKKIAASV